MKCENDLNGRAEDEIARLQQENYELKRDLKRISAYVGAPGRWFATGQNETVSNFPGQLHADNPPRKYKFSDLVNTELIKKLLNSFYVATGIPYGLHDEENNIISGKGWQDICIKFHRACPATGCRCKQSDTYIAAHLYDGPYVGYKCMNGLMDFGVPIIVEGQHVAAIFLGQFLHEPPDKAYFRRQARKYGFNEVAYMEALSRVPIIPEEQIEAIMEFYSQLGQILATIGLERKRQLEAADQTIREQQERLNMVWETINDGFWEWDMERDELIMSPRWGEMLGYSPEDLEPHFSTWSKLIHPDDIDVALKLLSGHTNGERSTFEAEYRMLSKTGQWIWILARGQVVARNAKGQALRMAGINIDINQRKQAEQALRLSEESWEKAFDTSPILMAITTLENGRFIRVNKAFGHIWGYSNEEIADHSSIELGFWANPADRDAMVEKIKAGQSIHNMEIQWYKKGGGARLGLCSAEGIELNGELCILAVLTDITDLRQMEIEMTRLDRLNLVGEMAASIGHEIRNPMTIVRGYLQLMQEKKEYAADMEHFELMIEELDRANSIITEFLSLAKNKMVDMIPSDLNSIISRTMPLIQTQALRKEHRIKLEMQDLPAMPLDEKEIRQLILNLVNNGMEAMLSPGIITIRTFINNKDAVLAIADQGPGIDREFLDKLGTPFFTTKDQGTGLGLAVCYRIASRHNARIDIETSADGTAFYVCFPITADAKANIKKKVYSSGQHF